MVASKVPRPGAPSDAVTVFCSTVLPPRTVWTTRVASKTLAVPLTWKVVETRSSGAGVWMTIGSGSALVVVVEEPPHPAADRAPAASTMA